MSFSDLELYGSEAKVKEAGRLRLEGKDYVMQDGDILYCFDDGTWQVYKGPIALSEKVKVVKAKVRYLGKESNTTWMWL